MAAQYLERMGERIRLRRDELHLSRADVARRLPGKTNENAVYRWENGKHRPNDDTLEALADVLQTTVAYFLADEPVDSPTPDPFVGAPAPGQLDRIERKLDALLEIATALPVEGLELVAKMRAAVDQQDDTRDRDTPRATGAA